MREEGISRRKLLCQWVILTGVTAAGGIFGLHSSLPAKGEPSMVPISVEVKGPFPIPSDLKEKLAGISRNLIRKNLSDLLAKSSSANAETNVLEKTSKGYLVEIRVISLFKETFTAQMSRIEFAYEDGQVIVRKVDRSFQPR